MSKSANPTGTKPLKEQSQKEFEAYVKHDQRRQAIDRSGKR